MHGIVWGVGEEFLSHEFTIFGRLFILFVSNMNLESVLIPLINVVYCQVYLTLKALGKMYDLKAPTS